MLIRDADPEHDAVACAAIYAPYVSDSVISLELVPPTAAEFRQRIERIRKTHPYLVAVDDDGPDAGELAGFAYAGPHSERGGYRWCADVSVYLNERYHRRGIGSALYETIFSLLERQGIWTVCAGITTPNEASEALHRASASSWSASTTGLPTSTARGVMSPGWSSTCARSEEFTRDRPPPEPGPPARLG